MKKYCLVWLCLLLGLFSLLALPTPPATISHAVTVGPSGVSDGVITNHQANLVLGGKFTGVGEYMSPGITNSFYSDNGTDGYQFWLHDGGDNMFAAGFKIISEVHGGVTVNLGSILQRIYCQGDFDFEMVPHVPFWVGTAGQPVEFMQWLDGEFLVNNSDGAVRLSHGVVTATSFSGSVITNVSRFYGTNIYATGTAFVTNGVASYRTTVWTTAELKPTGFGDWFSNNVAMYRSVNVSGTIVNKLLFTVP